MSGTLVPLDEPGLQRIGRVEGGLNMSLEQRDANIRSSIRRGLRQFQAYLAPNPQPICLVGSGPSLTDPVVQQDLTDCAGRGYPLIAMNGSYGWLINHGYAPRALVILDGRPHNRRFLPSQPDPHCWYFLASQCAAEVFDHVEGWPNVRLWHCATREDTDIASMLDAQYGGLWQEVTGGCTVGLRALFLFRLLGFHNMELFGLDSCYMDAHGHAIDQPENADHVPMPVVLAGRHFACSVAQVSQALGFFDTIKFCGDHFQFNVHGDGLLAWMLAHPESAVDAITQQLPEGVSV